MLLDMFRTHVMSLLSKAISISSPAALADSAGDASSQDTNSLILSVYSSTARPRSMAGSHCHVISQSPSGSPPATWTGARAKGPPPAGMTATSLSGPAPCSFNARTRKRYSAPGVRPTSEHPVANGARWSSDALHSAPTQSAPYIALQVASGSPATSPYAPSERKTSKPTIWAPDVGGVAHVSCTAPRWERAASRRGGGI
mmetsp:Transcript_21173/g.63263  ORF Transcript_21173/g.63263 Transcript_21173/m.63263 type:complete len:200 (-) Transcript_21173:58-657(-)